MINTLETTSTFVKDSKLRMVEASEEGAAIIGVDSPSSLIGKTEMDMFPEELAIGYLENQRRAYNDPSYTSASWVLTPRGWEYWMHSFERQGSLLHGSTINISDSLKGIEFIRNIDIENQCLRLDAVAKGSNATTLTRFEMEIIRQYLLGYPLHQIARDLHKSRDTIKYHLSKFRRHAESWDPDKPLNAILMESGFGHFLLERPLEEWFLD